MFSHELALAQAHRSRRRASTTARKRALTEGGSERSLRASGNATGSLSFSGRKSSGFDANGNDVETATVPLALTYLEQVTTELSVTKKHADVRYVMTVRHAQLNVAWRHARSFDEYRKFQQRLLRRLQHGHFCGADCPWLYGFLKSYFPKKLVFTFSSARVVEARKQTLERFFAALYGFLQDRKNHCCAVVMQDFADELVDFIYGDALQQYGLENPVKSTPAARAAGSPLLRGRRSEGFGSQWDEPATPEKPTPRNETLTATFTGSSPASGEDDGTADDVNCGSCGICTSSLCGEAYASSSATTSASSFTLSSLSLSEEENTNSSNRSTGSLGAEMVPLSRSGSSGRSNNSGGFNPAWLGTLKNTGNSGSGSNRRNGSARRRATTYYLTTLSCGHQFHDECIVPKLNESMHCPTCGRLQTED
ncbi:hypothetical protein BBJ28_00009219 [Nothophytophthora sp. Chile5]|nr:hypothetical protein BBJ28_00009219 [Nothophytophthora sp. Chile5]